MIMSFQTATTLYAVIPQLLHTLGLYTAEPCFSKIKGRIQSEKNRPVSPPCFVLIWDPQEKKNMEGCAPVLASGWHPSLHIPQQLLEIRGAQRQALPQHGADAGSQERKPGRNTETSQVP